MSNLARMLIAAGAADRLARECGDDARVITPRPDLEDLAGIIPWSVPSSVRGRVRDTKKHVCHYQRKSKRRAVKKARRKQRQSR